ncbi:alpha/beta hydrolase [Actimicrobium antarcticum]|uniref:Alpha/beta fold hydrolase n=1 Tax=Actimicrobium antarcticum TaxID=1051899 RepID=A0ABP7SSB8_9BURK
MYLRFVMLITLILSMAAAIAAQQQRDEYIDAADPGIKLFVRSKQPETPIRATEDNVVLFIHGATYPSTPDFDLQYKDYSWADWMVSKGYIVYMFDKRNYGFSSRENVMDQPAANNRPATRSYLAIRDIGAVVDHIRKRHNISKVSLIGWSWGATTAGFYTSLNSEKVKKLVMYAPAYAYAQHTNLGAGSGSQDKRKPNEFNYAMGAYRLGTKSGNDNRWDGEIPVADKSSFREEGVRDAFALEALKTDPTSESRTPPSLRAPNGVMEDSFMQATGRRIWNAGSIYVPTLVIAGEFDTWSFPEDRDLLMRDLTNAPVKKSVLIKNATHFVLFEKPRFEFFEAISDFIKTP